MAQPEPPEVVIGYLTAIESPEHGFFGGYLIISAFGRPLEFHCTAPVRPNRAQQILYGPTLQPYLLGEQIGGTLLAQAKLQPQLVITDQSAMLCLRPRMKMPIVYWQSPASHSVVETTADDAVREVISTSNARREPPIFLSRRIVVADCELWLPSEFESDLSTARELLTHFAERVELGEPFERIHEAICEAQRIGARDQEAYGQAA